tara:strand:- start:910 stop:1104 length:195 start_codon:yes stop_codon:yes gene_type:complete
MRVIPIDVYDKDGNFSKIEVQGADGEHVVDIVWDPADEQTSENRILFRKFAYRVLEQKGYEVNK